MFHSGLYCRIRGRLEWAADAAGAAVVGEAIPHSEDARVGLAVLYRSQGRDTVARQALAELVAQAPVRSRT